jgi:hypothetical protein
MRIKNRMNTNKRGETKEIKNKKGKREKRTHRNLEDHPRNWFPFGDSAFPT